MKFNHEFHIQPQVVYGDFFEKLIHKLKILCYNGFNKFYGIIFENFFKRNFESA